MRTWDLPRIESPLARRSPAEAGNEVWTAKTVEQLTTPLLASEARALTARMHRGKRRLLFGVSTTRYLRITSAPDQAGVARRPSDLPDADALKCARSRQARARSWFRASMTSISARVAIQTSEEGRGATILKKEWAPWGRRKWASARHFDSGGVHRSRARRRGLLNESRSSGACLFQNGMS